LLGIIFSPEDGGAMLQTSLQNHQRKSPKYIEISCPDITRVLGSVSNQVYMCPFKTKLTIHESTTVKLIRMTANESDDRTGGKHGFIHLKIEQ
jgi:hypothetical protein